MEPQEKAQELFNSIRNIDSDCTIIPIAKLICEELMQFAHQSNDISKYNYYQDVKKCLDNL